MLFTTNLSLCMRTQALLFSLTSECCGGTGRTRNSYKCLKPCIFRFLTLDFQIVSFFLVLIRNSPGVLRSSFSDEIPMACRLTLTRADILHQLRPDPDQTSPTRPDPAQPDPTKPDREGRERDRQGCKQTGRQANRQAKQANLRKDGQGNSEGCRFCTHTIIVVSVAQASLRRVCELF